MKRVHVILLALMLCQTSAESQPRDTSFNSSLRLINNLYQKLAYYYIEPLDKDKLTRKAIDGMMSLLDPWSFFMSRAEADAKKVNLTNKFAGIGISFRKLDEEFVVTEVTKNYAADKAGIKPGDVIVSVNGKSIRGLTHPDVVDAIRGEPATVITVQFKRPGSSSLITTKLKREIIKLTSVPYYGMLDDQTGFISLNAMADGSHVDVRNALNELKKNPSLQGVILDLRENGGGYRREAEAVSNLFLEKGKMIVRIKGKVSDTTYYTVGEPVDAQIPLVVLISKSTASSAEILSGALQDHDRAVFIGQRSLGKGMIQNIHDLGNGNQATITLAYYYTPSGRCIQSRDFSDGIEKVISDSLHKTFKTKNGRPVRSHDAINPDIVTEPSRLPLLAWVAFRDNLFYKYAVDYRLKHPEIAPASEFTLGNTEFNEFYQTLLKGNYSTNTEADKKLDEWKQAAIESGEWKQNEAAYLAFKKAIEDGKLKELEAGKDIVKRWLESEISSMYYFDRGRVEASINKDPAIQKAKEILAKREMYNNILGKK